MSRWFLLFVLFCSSPAAAQTPISVTLQSGRTFAGIVDRASDDKTLVLRSGSATVSMQRPIAWESVASAMNGDQAISIDDLKKLAAADNGAAAPTIDNVTKPNLIIRRYPPPPPPEPQPPAPNPPNSLRMDAAVVNWDQDVENDGLLVMLEPVDVNGFVTPVSGTAEITWYGGRFSGGWPDRGWKAERLGYWQVPVRSSELTYRGYLLKLPFQNLSPEFDMRMVNYSLVNVRLNVPGAGMLETSLDGIRVRPWSPFRDMLQQRNQTRWLPTEMTGRGKNSP